MDPSKITFGWNDSLRVTARRRNFTVSKWLREADGSKVKMLNKESKGEGKIPGRMDLMGIIQGELD